MARTALTPVVLTANTVTADPAGTALDATNSHSFATTVPLENYVVRVKNTTSSTKTVTLKSSNVLPADPGGAGDLVLSLTDGSSTPTVAWFGVSASSRYIQHDGTVNLDVASGMTGTITVFRVPRTA